MPLPLYNNCVEIAFNNLNKSQFCNINDNDTAVSLPGHVSHCATVFAYCSTLAQTQAKLFSLRTGLHKVVRSKCFGSCHYSIWYAKSGGEAITAYTGIAFEGGKYYRHGLAGYLGIDLDLTFFIGALPNATRHKAVCVSRCLNGNIGDKLRVRPWLAGKHNLQGKLWNPTAEKI